MQDVMDVDSIAFCGLSCKLSFAESVQDVKLNIELENSLFCYGKSSCNLWL